MPRKYIYLFILSFSTFCIIRCDLNLNKKVDSPFKNIANKNARYVGIDECRKCHEGIYQTFIKTGMGQSFGLATPQKSAADFSPDKAWVYDSFKNYYYKPFWRNDSLIIAEIRLQNSDTIHYREEYIKYIIGSGQHTNSHIIERNGYLYQAPITYYTQKKKWDMAPGFEKGMNSRFDRKIELECMSCHNALPKINDSSFNKYHEVPLGINCERCHGPGSIHVDEKMRGEYVDTSKGADYSIVNPKRLSIELQNNLCMRCHLQGISVLENGSSFSDFEPSMNLNEHMTTYLPSIDGQEDKMIMASHVERLNKSKCFVVSKKISCITCHNPHISVNNTPKSVFDAQCIHCHSTTRHKIEIENKSCVDCHMKKSTSIDIPHVMVTDHHITIPNIQDTLQAKIFNGIVSVNNTSPSYKSMASGYLELYERYIQKTGLLDSALNYIAEDDMENRVTYLYLKNDYNGVSALLNRLSPNQITNSWTAYKIGESLNRLNLVKEANPYFKRAYEISPLMLDFTVKFAVSELMLGNQKHGFELLQFILSENPKHELAIYNLGIYFRNQNKLKESNTQFALLHRLNPDFQP